MNEFKNYSSFFFLSVSIENIRNSRSTSLQNCHNFCMDDVVITKFGQNVQSKILFIYL